MMIPIIIIRQENFGEHHMKVCDKKLQAIIRNINHVILKEVIILIKNQKKLLKMGFFSGPIINFINLYHLLHHLVSSPLYLLLKCFLHYYLYYKEYQESDFDRHGKDFSEMIIKTVILKLILAFLFRRHHIFIVFLPYLFVKHHSQQLIIHFLIINSLFFIQAKHLLIFSIENLHFGINPCLLTLKLLLHFILMVIDC